MVYFLFDNTSTFTGYLIPLKKPLKKDPPPRTMIQPITGVQTFPKLLIKKVIVIAWLEFELTYFEAAIQHYNSYATGTLAKVQWMLFLKPRT